MRYQIIILTVLTFNLSCKFAFVERKENKEAYVEAYTNNKIDSIFVENKILKLDSNSFNTAINLNSNTIIKRINPYCGIAYDFFRKMRMLDSLGVKFSPIVIIPRPEYLNYRSLNRLKTIYNIPLYYEDTSKFCFEKNLEKRYGNIEIYNIYLINKNKLIKTYDDVDSLNYLIQ